MTTVLSLDNPLKIAAFDVLTGRDTAQSHKTLKDARHHVEDLKSKDPVTYQLVKKAIIETIKRNVKPKRLRSY